MRLVVKLVAEDASDLIANGERSLSISHEQNGGVGLVSSFVGDGKKELLFATSATTVCAAATAACTAAMLLLLLLLRCCRFCYCW